MSADVETRVQVGKLLDKIEKLLGPGDNRNYVITRTIDWREIAWAPTIATNGSFKEWPPRADVSFLRV